MSLGRLLLLATVVFSGTAFTFAQPLIQKRVIINARVAPVAVQANPTPTVELSDEEALESAGLKPSDAKGLLDYLRMRTLSDADLSKIQAVIQRLGAEAFDDRLQAMKEVEQFGPAAIVPLRTVTDNSKTDPEIVYRAGECLQHLEKIPHAQVAAAAVRALVKLHPAEATEVLLAFLPMADSAALKHDIRTAMISMALRDGKPDPAIVKALDDPNPLRRIAAVVALVEGGPKQDLIHIPSTFPKVLETVAAERDPESKFQMLFSLVVTARQPQNLDQLIDLIPTLPRGRIWQTEDFLLQLAGKAAPKVVFGMKPESLTAARDAWKAWWNKASGSVKLAEFTYQPKISGHTMIVMLDTRGGSTSVVMELGPDMNETWKISGLSYSLDAARMPNGDVAIAEMNASRVTVRDTQGNIKRTITTTNRNRIYANPHQLQVLENGNLLIVCRNVIYEFKPGSDTPVMTYVHTKNGGNSHEIQAARRLSNGETLVLLQTPPFSLYLDAKGKVLATKSLKNKMPSSYGAIAELDSGKILITESNRIAEYDPKDGSLGWTHEVIQPRSLQRLPNGNTLLVEPVRNRNPNRVIEITPNGEEVWSYEPENGFQVFRAYRR